MQNSLGCFPYHRQIRQSKIQNIRTFFLPSKYRTSRKLYECALKYANLTGKETVIDGYCGTGTISLFLAQKAKKVYGMEIVPEAIRDAIANARDNNIRNAEF